jgi:hypothetical protein
MHGGIRTCQLVQRRLTMYEGIVSERLHATCKMLTS